jgi:hypothetical protein
MLKKCFLCKIINVHNLKDNSEKWIDIIQNKKHLTMKWKLLFPDMNVEAENVIKDLKGIGL